MPLRIGPPRRVWRVGCACATFPGHCGAKVVIQKVTTLKEAVAILVGLYDTNDLCLHYSSDQGDLLEAAIEYLRGTFIAIESLTSTSKG